MSEQICKIDKSLIDSVIHKKLGDILGFSIKRTDNKQDAEDLTQDIIIEIYKSFSKMKSYDGPEALEGWIWAIAKHTYCNFLNRRKKNNVVYIEGFANEYEQLDSVTNIDDNFIKEEQLNNLRKEIGLLSKNYRDIVVLYYLEDKTCNEIANMLGLTLNTVKWRLHEAKRMIKDGMSNMTNYTERSYAPGSLWVNSSGTFNSDYSCYYLYDQLKSLLRQNIVLCCYREILTIAEISVELGVPRAYIEEEVEILAEEEILKEAGAGKYQADFVIVTREIKEKLYPIFEEIGREIAEVLLSLVSRAEDNIRNVRFIGSDKPWEELLWFIIPHCVYSSKTMSSTIEMPLRPHGNRWIVVGFEGLKREYPWNSTLNITKSLKGTFSQAIFWTNKLTYRAGHLKEKECIFYRDCVQGKIDLLKLSTDNEEIAVQLMNKGFLTRRKDKLNLNMIAFNEKQFEEYSRIIDELLQNFDNAIFNNAYELIKAELERWVPAQIKKDDLQPYIFLLLQDIAGYTIKALFDKNIFKMPDELETSVKGMYAVVKQSEEE